MTDILKRPDGACCTANCVCVYTKLAFCLDSYNGIPHGNQTCADTDCGERACCLPGPPPHCEIMCPVECRDAGGLRAPSHSCDPDPCEVPCCEWGPDGVTCSMRQAVDCAADGGIVKWDHASCEPDPCDDGACCLCRGQCKDMIGGAGWCAQENGEWHEHTTCEHLQQTQACLTDRKRTCQHAQFSVTPDILADPMRYRPISIDLMDPHEYVRGPEHANCRQWWGNVSAEHGAWSCGQWDMNVPATMLHFRLQVMIDDTGRGRFWTEYRPVCPEYS